MLTTTLQEIFKRDLLKLKAEIEAYKDETNVWAIDRSVTNSAGNLCLHLIGKVVKKEISVKNGLKQEDAKKIVKAIKDAGLKVQPAIMDNIIRVTGKKLDDLQEVIALCKTGNFGLPLQYENMKS